MNTGRVAQEAVRCKLVQIVYVSRGNLELERSGVKTMTR